jgi:ATP-dependent protease Clp ATPase subunit
VEWGTFTIRVVEVDFLLQTPVDDNRSLELNLVLNLLQVDLILEPEALQLIANQALEKKTGARGLRAIMVRHYIRVFTSTYVY